MEILLTDRMLLVSATETCFHTTNEATIFDTFDSLPKRSKIKIVKDRIISKYLKDLADKNVMLPYYIPEDLFWDGVQSGEIKISKSRFRCDVELSWSDDIYYYYSGSIFMKTESRELYDMWIVAKLTAMHAD
jgi:hypothetical protein